MKEMQTWSRNSPPNGLPPGWRNLISRLTSEGMNSTTAEAWGSYALTRFRQISERPPAFRLLHPLESDFVGPSAHGQLLQLLSLGLLDPEECDKTIDATAFLPRLPADENDILNLAARTLEQSFRAHGFGKTH